jgi:hypothetical protein
MVWQIGVTGATCHWACGQSQAAPGCILRTAWQRHFFCKIDEKPLQRMDFYDRLALENRNGKQQRVGNPTLSF